MKKLMIHLQSRQLYRHTRNRVRLWKNEQIIILGGKAFSNQQNFWISSPKKFEDHQPKCFSKNKECLLKSSKLYAKREMIAAKLVVSNYKTQTTLNVQGFSCNSLLKGLQRRALLQDPCQEELCKRLEFQWGMACCCATAAHLLWIAAAAQHWVLNTVSAFTDNLLYVICFLEPPVKLLRESFLVESSCMFQILVLKQYS